MPAASDIIDLDDALTDAAPRVLMLPSWRDRHDRIGKAVVLKDGVAALAAPPSDPLMTDAKTCAATVIISTQQRDHSRDVIDSFGIDVSVHKSNPVCLYEHGKAKSVPFPVGKAEDPSGRYTVRVEDDRTVGTTYFAQSNRQAMSVFSLIHERVLRGASVGFKPRVAARFSDGEGTHFKSVLLVEYSHVVIPDNWEALLQTVSRKSVGGERLDPLVLKSLSDYADALPRHPRPVVVPPLPPAVAAYSLATRAALAGLRVARKSGIGWVAKSYDPDDDGDEKAYDASLHPRGKNGRFIPKKDIAAAAGDPAKEKELLDKVKPEDRDKLQAAMASAHADKKGKDAKAAARKEAAAKKEAAAAEREAAKKEAAAKKQAAAAAKKPSPASGPAAACKPAGKPTSAKPPAAPAAPKPPSAAEVKRQAAAKAKDAAAKVSAGSTSPEHLSALADGAEHLSVPELKEMRAKLGAAFKLGAKGAMVAGLREHVKASLAGGAAPVTAPAVATPPPAPAGPAKAPGEVAPGLHQSHIDALPGVLNQMKLFTNYRDGLIDVGHLASVLQEQTGKPLSPPQMRSLLMTLAHAGGLELHILNEVRQVLENPRRAAYAAYAPERDGTLYNYALVGDPAKLQATLAKVASGEIPLMSSPPGDLHRAAAEAARAAGHAVADEPAPSVAAPPVAAKQPVAAPSKPAPQKLQSAPVSATGIAAPRTIRAAGGPHPTRGEQHPVVQKLMVPNPALPDASRPDVNEAMVRAIHRYTGADAGEGINLPLRGQGQMTAKAAAHHEALQAAFAVTPVMSKPVEVYRGMTLPFGDDAKFAAKLQASLSSGKPLVFDGYVSTSTDRTLVERSYAGGSRADPSRTKVVMKIAAIHGLDIDPHSQEPQKELLLNHQSQFRVKGVKHIDGRMEVELEQLPPVAK